MTSLNEQQRLLADTLDFVRRLAGTGHYETTTMPALVPARPANSPRYADERDLKKEMQARLEAFRNRQRFLEIEREAHYQQAMQRIRTATEQWTER